MPDVDKVEIKVDGAAIAADVQGDLAFVRVEESVQLPDAFDCIAGAEAEAACEGGGRRGIGRWRSVRGYCRRRLLRHKFLDDALDYIGRCSILKL